MWPILAAFLAGMYFTVERVLALRLKKHVPATLEKDIVHAVDMRGTDAGIALCLESKSSLGRVLRQFLLRQGGTRPEMELVVRNECKSVHYELLMNTRKIGLMLCLAPLCGIVGSGIALIAKLDRLGMEGNNPATLASAAAGALLPFVFGLLVSIPLMYSYFRLRAIADDVAHEIDEKAIDVVLVLDRKARQSIRLIEDIEDQIKTKDMPGIKALPPDLAAEFEDHGREGSGVKTGITTPAHLPAAIDENVKRK